MPKELPSHSQVVVVGGGIIGCSVAYHLTKEGWTDVSLLERKSLTSGTTWAAAGLCAQVRATRALTSMAVYGTELYGRLEEETEQATGYRTLGSILCAQTKDRRSEYERAAAMARSFRLEMHRISPKEAKDLFPFLHTDDLEAIYWCPNDGVTNPVDTAMALAKGARQGGANIYEETMVTGFHIENCRVKGVSTNRGDISCEYVVLSAGMWSGQLGARTGLSIPMHAAEHMHVVTQPIEGVTKTLPTLRDMDSYIYVREEVGGLMLGGFEPKAKPWGEKGIPLDIMFHELNEDWDQFQIFVDGAVRRIPIFETAEIRHLSVVPESFTPDGLYMLGEAPRIRNFYVATGMNSLGIASAAGAGRALAHWIVSGSPQEDLWEVDVRRYFDWQKNAPYRRDRITEIVGLLYADHYPFRQFETARPVHRSPFHERLAKDGACFGSAFGWERANWFAPEGTPPRYEYSWGRQNWFELSAAEHMAVRENVGMYDLSSMAQFLVQGPDALKALQHICANNVDVPCGKVVYTQLLNDRGGIEADLTVTRLDDGVFLIITAGACATRDFDWIERHIPEGASVVITDVSAGWCMLGLMGPKSRDLLSSVCPDDLSNEAFPYGTAKYIDVGYARVLALRMSYVGELGWELYAPPSLAGALYDSLMEAGKAFDLKLVGLHALDSLRLEKGYRHWGSDIGPDDTPLEAGLGFAVKFNKGDFIGREKLLEQKKSGANRKLALFTLNDPEPLLYHDEPVYRDGELVSRNTHGAYAHKLGRAMGMCWIELPEGAGDEWLLSGKYEVDVEGTLVPAQVSLGSIYDPSGQRIKG